MSQLDALWPGPASAEDRSMSCTARRAWCWTPERCPEDSAATRATLRSEFAIAVRTGGRTQIDVHRGLHLQRLLDQAERDAGRAVMTPGGRCGRTRPVLSNVHETVYRYRGRLG